MKLRGFLTISALLLLFSCSKKKEVQVIDNSNTNYSFSGIITTPSGTPLADVLVTFDDGTTTSEHTTDSSGEFQFDRIGNGSADLYFYGNHLAYLDMRDLDVPFGEFNRTFNKTMVPWEIEEIDLLNAEFIDNPEKSFALVQHNFEEVKMQPSDFKNLIGSQYLEDYQTIFTSVQSEEESVVTVSFYSMPNGAGYNADNKETIPYSEVLNWKKIKTISTTTTPIGVLEPVTVNLAAAYANHPDYDHSGLVVMVTDEIGATLGVTSSVDILEIRLPYGDDY